MAAAAPEAPEVPAVGAAETAETAATARATGVLRGCYVRTPYGWGICTEDDPGILHVQVALDWRLQNRKRVQCAIRRTDILERSFCAAGECVLTAFGTGVLLGFRPSDGMHHVHLWGPFGRGRNHAYLRREALLAVVPAAAGLAVETPYGPGVCLGYRTAAATSSDCPGGPVGQDGGAAEAAVKDGEMLVVVDLPWGHAVMRPSCVSCPVAVTLPLINCFLERAASLFKVHSSTLTNLRDALQGIGLEKLQERLTTSAAEAAEAASKFWGAWESQDASSVMDSLKLKADEVLADPQMKEVVNAGIARLNKLVCKAEGFDGVWVGQEDKAPRATVSDAVVTWHWGEASELEIWGSSQVSTVVDGDTFRGTLHPDGSLEWSDGDRWVRTGVPVAAADGGAEDSQAVEGAGGAADTALVQRSLQDLRQIIGGEGLEQDVEETLGALARVASNDDGLQKIVGRLRERRESILDLKGQVMQSKTAQVLQEGQSRLSAQLKQIRETAITPQLERVQHRSSRFLTRLTNDRTVKSKAVALFSAAQARLTERWNDPDNPQRGNVEAWVTKVKAQVLGQLSIHRTMLAESLSGLKLHQLDVSQLIANAWDPVSLELQLEKSLVSAIKLSGVNLSGAELLDRFESSALVSQIPVVQRTYQGILVALGDLNIDIPLPIRKLLEAQATGQSQDAQSWKTAIVNSLDDESVVKGASDLVSQGESLLTQFGGIQASKTVAKVMEHLENENLERDLLKHINGIDPEEILNGAEGALTSAEAREALISKLKDTCLEFILKILPALHIEKLAGTDEGCDWEINNISFSDFSFRKENVYITFGGTSTFGDEELLRVSGWDISAHFRNLKVTVKQTSFPYLQAEGTATAKAERMSVAFAFKYEPVRGATTPQLLMSSRSVHMESLELWVGETNYAMIINALSFLFEDVLKEYACQKIAKHLDEHIGGLVEALNSMLETCMPLLEKIGVKIPTLSGQEAKDSGVEPEMEPPTAPVESGEFPVEIGWADPGRSFAVRS